TVWNCSILFKPQQAEIIFLQKRNGSSRFAHSRLKLLHATGVNLERIFAKRSTRKVLKDLSFSYQGVVYQIDTDKPNRFNKSYVTILDRPGKPILVERDGKSYAYKEWKKGFSERPKILNAKELEAYWRSAPPKPKKRHPWR
ncbi:MAG: hypothetical protein AB7O96_00795, partial [Pseudobdellovibrionaceae bacterium]